MFELSYGKPAETIELDPVTLDPFQVAEMTQGERGIMLSRVLEQHPQLAELVPERLRSVEESTPAPECGLRLRDSQTAPDPSQHEL